MFDLKDRVFVLTGVTGALGGALAQSLARVKAKLVLLGRSENLLKELKSKLEEQTTVTYHVVDVMSQSQLIEIRTKILDEFGRIDSLINAVGGNLPGAVIPDDKSIFDMSETDFDEVVDLNLKGTLLPSIVFGKVMAEFLDFIERFQKLDEELDEGDELSKFLGALKERYNFGIDIDHDRKQRIEEYFDYRWKNDKNIALDDAEEQAFFD